jgi:hypothetical protein
MTWYTAIISSIPLSLVYRTTDTTRPAHRNLHIPNCKSQNTLGKYNTVTKGVVEVRNLCKFLASCTDPVPAATVFERF